jgi:tRNA threonylcarbamoyl adenosine modification protein YeaZ
MFDDIEKLLSAGRIDFDQVDALAVGLGPGSFTGIRIAVATFRTLSQATSKKLIGVGTLAMYAKPLAAFDPNALVIPTLFSRRGEAYAAIYRNDIEIKAPFVTTYSELLETSKRMSETQQVVFTGPKKSLPTEFSQFSIIDALAPSAEGFAALASEAYRSEKFSDCLNLNPVYAAPPAINQHKDPHTLERMNSINSSNERSATSSQQKLP